MISDTFSAFFFAATGQAPFPYQERLAYAAHLPALIDVPTGAGKTYAVALSWAWRRLAHPDPTLRAYTPRRLVYCLPMRNLVQQTVAAIQAAFECLGLNIPVHVLLGGDIDDEWMRRPESEAVLVGTQDLLLSRALMRGYAMRRSRWPVAFGLLHNDALWVMDEVQLMGAALPTSAQLEGFRQQLGHLGGVQTVWLSATLRPDWVETVDHAAPAEPFRLAEADRNHPVLRQRLEAPKQLRQHTHAGAKEKGYEQEVARLVTREHLPGTLSLVILNTVERAVAVSRSIQKAGVGPVLLLHSRFRPAERAQQLERLQTLTDGVICATQVVEAGVDLDARLLVTELAPWPSLVQRFGRCNRRGERADAAIYWLDLEEKASLPYGPADLAAARQTLQRLEDTSAAPANLPPINLPRPETDLLRRRDLITLFDTMPDLSGNDADVGRFIRDIDELDLYVFWRDLAGKDPDPELPAPVRDELCPVPIGSLREALKKRKAWAWNHLTEKWLRASQLRPGITLLMDAAEGGYTLDIGWDPRSTERVPPLPAEGPPPEVPRDDLSGPPELLASHTDKVVAELEQILSGLPFLAPYADHLRQAARWHDAGKAHDIFQATMQKGLPPGAPVGIWAKSNGRHRHARRHFRHELGSGLALLQNGGGFLAAYLVGAHHGHVRLSIRTLDRESPPREAERRYALGIYDRERLAEADLGGGVRLSATELDLSPMELGAPLSWTAAALGLRDDPELGPFRLAFLEAVLRAADWRGSANQTEEVAGT